MWVSMVGVDSIRDWLDDLLISFDTPPSLKATPLQTISHKTQLAWSCFVYFVLFCIILFYSFYIYIYIIKAFLCYFSPSIFFLHF
jgi:hypothetical protein